MGNAFENRFADASARLNAAFAYSNCAYNVKGGTGVTGIQVRRRLQDSVVSMRDNRQVETQPAELMISADQLALVPVIDGRVTIPASETGGDQEEWTISSRPRLRNGWWNLACTRTMTVALAVKRV